MIVINKIEYNINGSSYTSGYSIPGDVQHNISLSIYSDRRDKFKPCTTEQLILNELLLKEYGFGLDEIKKYFPEHFI